MEFLFFAGIAIGGLLVLPQLFAKAETKLFRRIWSAERLMMIANMDVIAFNDSFVSAMNQMGNEEVSKEP